jgi:hypothetical protein
MPLGTREQVEGVMPSDPAWMLPDSEINPGINAASDAVAQLKVPPKLTS